MIVTAGKYNGCDSNGRNGLHVGWIESKYGLHCFSIMAAVAGSNEVKVDLSTLQVDDELSQLLSHIKSKKWFADTLNSTKSAISFAKELQSMVSDAVERSNYTSVCTSNGYITRVSMTDISDSTLPNIIIGELNKIGWDSIVSINEDLTKLTLKTSDARNRVHPFDIEIIRGYPSVAPTVSSSLPGGRITIPWTVGRSDLSSILRIINEEIERYETLFDVLDDIDQHAWVLEPSKPTYAISSRRIVIDKSCSLLLDISADNPTQLCPIKVLGPPEKKAQLLEMLSKNMTNWTVNSVNITKNIEALLEVALPTRNNSNGDNDDNCLVECGICYSYSSLSSSVSTTAGMSTCVPDQICPNSKCSRMYHADCLVRWLQSVPSTRCSFGTLFGSCIYCSNALSVQANMGIR